MHVQVTPPPVEDIAAALKPVLTTGLPVRPDYDDETVLALRGVVARTIDPSDRLNRVKALDGLLRRQLMYLPDDSLGEPARVLFGLVPGTRGASLTARRGQAAREAGYDADHFRKHVEPRIIDLLAWQLHQDSQNYIPRSRAVPPPLEASGDTPTVTAGDIATKEAAEHEEMLSRLWAGVYALRAEILKVEILKSWPLDASEPTTSSNFLANAIEARSRAVQTVRLAVATYIDRYGQRIEHGNAEFDAAALLRLAGWDENAS